MIPGVRQLRGIAMPTFYPPVNWRTPSQLAPNCDLPSHYRSKNAPCKMTVRSMGTTRARTQPRQSRKLGAGNGVNVRLRWRHCCALGPPHILPLGHLILRPLGRTRGPRTAVDLLTLLPVTVDWPISRIDALLAEAPFALAAATERISMSWALELTANPVAPLLAAT